MLPPNERVYVGIDVPTAKEACRLVGRLASSGCGFKIGPHFVLDEGFSQFITGLSNIDNGRFFDQKHLDIPETVRAAVANAARHRFNYVTVHARSRKNLEAAVKAVNGTSLNVLAVPLLTSDDEAFDTAIVRERIDWTIAAGCQGIICSPQDVTLARKLIPDHFLIGTPGIVMDDHNSRDHARFGTPEQAIGDGANFIVVARYIIQADDPVGALYRVIDRIK